MENMLFTERSIWTMIHGIVLGGGALIAPPDALANLSHYPKSLIQSNTETAWLHAFAMESKEHVPWIAAMLATSAAFIGVHYRTHLLSDRTLNQMATALVTVSFILVAYMSILGVFINKVAPLE